MVTSVACADNTRGQYKFDTVISAWTVVMSLNFPFLDVWESERADASLVNALVEFFHLLEKKIINRRWTPIRVIDQSRW
jgi:hypothetical protein